MKRLCFDTESNYFKSPTSGIGEPAAHREYFRSLGKRFRFDCGVVYDAESNIYLEFKRDEAAALVEVLTTADELISHSGRRADFIVLEYSLGKERVGPLWKTELVLVVWTGWQRS
jgi:hypothetical protein